MEGTVYSLIPALLTLILVLMTRKVLLSLGAGVVVGAFLLHEFQILPALEEIWTVFITIFISEGEWNLGSLYLLTFLLLLGITTAFMTASGGSRAFGEWAGRKVSSRKGAQLMPAFLGLIIFIDDYFNSLVVGQVARPLTDRYKVSRAKLAYIIDSTSAPITVITPISSWGAYIIGTIAFILAENEINDYQPLEAFVTMIPLNLYAFSAILLVFLTIFLKMDVGSMNVHENRAVQTGDLVDPDRSDVPGDLNEAFTSNAKGSIYHLIIPILVLVIASVAAMLITGNINSGGAGGILGVFENTDVNISLFIGGLAAVVSALLLYLILGKTKPATGKVFIEGIKAMLPAIYILILAWMIGAVIENMGTGVYLAGLVEQASLNPAFLPFLLFIVAGFMALATGTSWGTFGIMLPIAGALAATTDASLVLASLAAVLAGSVFGDHCSPISDTTILSSTGAGSNHIDHVMTQLPYALIGAVAAAAGYLIIGFTGWVWLPLVFSLVLVTILGLVIHSWNRKKN